MHKNLLLIVITLSFAFSIYAWANEVDLANLEKKDLKHKCDILKRLDTDMSKTNKSVIEQRQAERASIKAEIDNNESLREACK